MDTPDSVLLQAVAVGDEGALATLIGRHHRQVRAACARQCPPAVLDDCVQAVFLVLHRRSAAAARSPVLLAWLLRVAYFVCQRAGQAERRRRRAETEAKVRGGNDAGADPTVLDHLDAALLKLSEQQRAAVLLHVVEGEAPAAVAERLGVSPGNAYKLIQRGLDGLRSFLQRRGVPVSAAALSACLVGDGRAAETVDLVGLLARGPSQQAERLASEAVRGMRLGAVLPLVGTALIGAVVAWILAFALAWPPDPPAPVPPVPPAAEAADPRLDVPVTMLLGGANLSEAVAELNVFLPLRSRLDFALPQQLAVGVLDEASLLDPAGVSEEALHRDPIRRQPPLAVLLPPGSTVRTALDGIAAQAGCTWRLMGGLVCFEQSGPALAVPPAGWDVVTVHRALVHGEARVVRQGIAAWLDLPERELFVRHLADRGHWLGRAVLAEDPVLAARLAQAYPGLPALIAGRPLPAVGVEAQEQNRLWLARLRQDIEESQPSAYMRGAVDELLELDDVGELSFYERELACWPAAEAPGFARALCRLLAVRGGFEARRRMLAEGVLVEPVRYGNHAILAQGADPAWRQDLAAALQRAGRDPVRQAAEAILAHSADPAAWDALLLAWQGSVGEDRVRMTAALLAGGGRGVEAILFSLRSGGLGEAELSGALHRSDDFGLTSPVIGLATALAGDQTRSPELRLAAAELLAAVDFPVADPAAVRVAHGLLAEGVATGNVRYRGVGLQLLHRQEVLAAADPALEDALRDASPYLRCVGLTICEERQARVARRAEQWAAPVHAGQSQADAQVAQRFLALAHDDPCPAVRIRAAAVAWSLLAAADREPALQRLRDAEPAAVVRERYATQDFTGLGFPTWRQAGADGDDVVAPVLRLQPQLEPVQSTPPPTVY